MAKGKSHSDEVRAQVIAALLAGQGASDVARQYHIDKSVVSRWKATLSAGDLQQVATEKKERIGDLIAGYLNDALTTLSIQAIFARNQAWLEKQSAENLAVLHGVIADKSIRILEAIEPAETGLSDQASDSEPAVIH